MSRSEAPGMWPTAKVMSHCAHVCHISLAQGCRNKFLPWLAGLEDDDSSLVIAEQVEEVVGKFGSPQLYGQRGIESIEVTNGRVALEYSRREGNMVHSASCEAPQPDMQASM